MPSTSRSAESFMWRSHSWPSGAGISTSKPESGSSANMSKNRHLSLRAVLLALGGRVRKVLGVALIHEKHELLTRVARRVEGAALDKRFEGLAVVRFESRRLTKSCSYVNGTFASRSAMMASATLAPTPRMPARPKRTPSSVGVNSAWTMLMSGGSTGNAGVVAAGDVMRIWRSVLPM